MAANELDVRELRKPDKHPTIKPLESSARQEI
jgi:hypothetical protein